MKFFTNDRTLVWDGGCVRFPRQEAALFQAAASANGKAASLAVIASAMWPCGNEPSYARQQIGVIAYKVRQRLVGAPVRLICVWSAGYRLDAKVEIPDGHTLTITPAAARDLRTLLETHPNAALVSRTYAALGLA